MLTATQDAINDLMEAGDNNRVTLVGFSNQARVLLELDHYEPGSIKLEVAAGENGDNAPEKQRSVVVKVNDKEVDTFPVAQLAGSNVNKYTQMGVYTALNELLKVPENDLTVTVNGQKFHREPAMLLMSEGEPKIGSTWVYAPETNNVSLTQVPRTKSYNGTSWDGDDEPNIKKYALDSHDDRYAQTFATMMSAGYWKKEVSKHYSEDDADPTKHPVHFYTVAIDESFADSPNLAEIALNPTGAVKNAESNQYGTMDQRFKYLIKTLFKNGSVQVESGLRSVNDWNKRLMNFNAKNGITEQDFYYNDARYLINDQEGDAKYEWDRILGSVVSEITSVSPQAPTQVTDEGEAASGYVTYTDPIGQYMEVKDGKGLVYADNVYHYSETKSNTTSYPKRYVFEGTVANGVYPSGI